MSTTQAINTTIGADIVISFFVLVFAIFTIFFVFRIIKGIKNGKGPMGSIFQQTRELAKENQQIAKERHQTEKELLATQKETNELLKQLIAQQEKKT